MGELSELESVAYHEAGHAVAAIRLRRAFKKASIIPEEGSAGRVSGFSEWFPDQYLLNTNILMRMVKSSIIIDFCGVASAEKQTGVRDWETATHDLSNMINVALSVCSSAEDVSSYLDELWQDSINFVNNPENWADIEIVAKALLREKELSRKKIVQILKDEHQPKS